jgi:hypothetical protein
MVGKGGETEIEKEIKGVEGKEDDREEGVDVNVPDAVKQGEHCAE